MGRWHGRLWTRAALIAAVLAVAPARAGPGVALKGPGGRPLHGSWQRWARASLMPTVGGRITLRLTGCPALPRAAGWRLPQATANDLPAPRGAAPAGGAAARDGAPLRPARPQQRRPRALPRDPARVQAPLVGGADPAR